MRAREVLLEAHMAQVAKVMRRRANAGFYDGRPAGMAYIAHCTWDDETTATRLIFTRDVGHHSSGWMRNPDYERCWHLSLSPKPLVIVVGSRQLAELDARTRDRWVKVIYGEHASKTWFESAKSDVGKERAVQHFRLFCDETWAPIVPRGEVYSSELTELGWRSASQVLEEDGVSIFSTVDPT